MIKDHTWTALLIGIAIVLAIAFFVYPPQSNDTRCRAVGAAGYDRDVHKCYTFDPYGIPHFSTLP